MNGATERFYNIFRWYRSDWTRYTQADPIGLSGGLNVFSYAIANPVMATDPNGLRARMCCRDIPDLAWTGQRHCYFKLGDGTTWGLHEFFGAILHEYSEGAARSAVGQTIGIPLENVPFDREPAEPGTQTCGPWSNDCAVSACVARASRNYPIGTYSNNPLTVRNSNTFARVVSEQCGVQAPAFVRNFAYGW